MNPQLRCCGRSAVKSTVKASDPCIAIDWHTDDGKVVALSLTVNEAYELVRHIRSQVDALRVKCPTCRCRIMPGVECSCCAYIEPNDAE